MQQRIVSLVPSLSETLFELGLRDELVGCTQFCVSPPHLHRLVTIVGGTKDFSLAAIEALNPTHILVNREENPRDPVEELAKKYKVLVTFPRGPEDVPSMLRDMGEFLAAQDSTEPWARSIEKALKEPLSGTKRGRFAYFIWKNPYMLAGPDTYISRLLQWAGWDNAYQGAERYPSLELGALAALDPDLLLLSSEPYPFRQRDAEKLRAEWPDSPSILKVDGRLLSWYGTSTLEALRFLARSSSIGKALKV